MTVPAAERYSLFDQFYDEVESETRPADHSTVIVFREGTDDPYAALMEGLRRAEAHYARVGATPKGRRWVPDATATPVLERVSGATDESEAIFRAFFDRPRDGKRLLQMLFFDTQQRRYTLLTRMHHSLGDGDTHLQVVDYQLRVAFGQSVDEGPESPLALRSHPAPVKRSVYAYAEPSDVMITRNAPRMRARHWQSVMLSTSALRRFADAHEETSVTAVLVDLVIQSVAHWMETTRPERAARICIFLTCNAREQRHRGLGNASSRVRIYGGTSAVDRAERCRHVHRQVQWTMKNGEWSFTVPSWAENLPAPLRGLLLRVMTRVVRWEPGTLLLAILERFGREPWSTLFPAIDHVYAVLPLSGAFPVSCAVMTHGEKTLFTMTYDPSLIPDADARQIAEHLSAQAATIGAVAHHAEPLCASA
jgi:hypothetical protein